MNEIGSSPKKSGLRVTWRGATLLVVAVVLLVFAVQNLQSAPVNFLGATIQLPVWSLVVGSFVLGMFLGGAVRGAARKLRNKPTPPHS
jgi:uncharacterized integral membrane protein